MKIETIKEKTKTIIKKNQVIQVRNWNILYFRSLKIIILNTNSVIYHKKEFERGHERIRMSAQLWSAAYFLIKGCQTKLDSSKTRIDNNE